MAGPWSFTSTASSPTIYYTITEIGRSRPDNSHMDYTFRITTSIGSGAKFGTGYILNAYIAGYYVQLKSSSESWGSSYSGSDDVWVRVNSSNTNNVTLSFSVSRGDSYGSAGTISSSFTNSVNALLYSSVTAPTSVSASTAITLPTSDVTISWSGASAGTNNAITGYEIFYTSDGTDPTTSSTPIYPSGTGTSYKFSLSGAERGTIYKFKVRTKGTVSGYTPSGLSSATATFTINSLPGAPTVTVDKGIVPYNNGNGASCSFTVTAGDDAQSSSQTRTLYYSTSEDGTKTRFTSPLSYTINGNSGGSQTLYFWTYDGLEYSSSYTSETVNINSIPTIDSLNVAPPGELISTTNGILAQTLNGSVTATANSSQSVSISSYTWYYSTNGTSSTTFGQNASSFSNYNVRTIVPTANQQFGIGVKVTDSLGDSSPIGWYTTSGASHVSSTIVRPFITAKATPTVSNIAVYNNTNATTVSGTVPYNFYRNMYVTWTQPSDITHNNGYFEIVNYTITINGNAVATTSGQTGSILLQNLSYDPGTKLTVGVQTNDEGGYTASTSISSMTVDGQQYNLEESIPPTIDADIVFSLVEPYRAYRPSTSNLVVALTSSTIVNSINSVNIKCNLSDTTGTPVIQSNISLSKVDNQYQATLSRTDIVNWFQTAYDTNPLNTDYTCLFTVTLSNNFGQTGSVLTKTYRVVFREPPIMNGTLSQSIIYYSQSGAVSLGNTPSIAARMLNTGDTIRLILSAAATDYNGNGNIDKYQIYVSRTITDEEPTSGFTLYREDTFTTSLRNIDIVLPQYAEMQFLWFRIYVIDKDGQQSENYLKNSISYIASRIQLPVVELLDVDVDSTHQVSGNWRLNNLGGNNNYNNYPNLERINYPSGYTSAKALPIIKLEYSTTSDFSTSEVTSNLNTVTGSFANYLTTKTIEGLANRAILNQAYQNKNLYMRLIVELPTSTMISSGSAPTGQVNENGQGYIVGVSNTVVYYSIAPTVAYRKNFLGINSEQFDAIDQAGGNNTIALINDYDDHRYIYFNGQLNTIPHLAYIDVKTGQLHNFIIDGGTWSST